MAKIEVMIMESEEGVSNFIKFATALKGKINFTYVRIMGDVHEYVGIQKLILT